MRHTSHIYTMWPLAAFIVPSVCGVMRFFLACWYGLVGAMSVTAGLRLSAGVPRNRILMPGPFNGASVYGENTFIVRA